MTCTISENMMLAPLTDEELLSIDGGFNADNFAKGIAAVGTVAGLCGLTPVAIVCGAYCAGYWIASAF